MTHPRSELEVAQAPRFRSYVVAVLCGLLIYFLTAALINYYFDPFTVYKPLRAWKHVPRTTNIERVTLSHDLRRAEPIDVLFIGSSRVRYVFGKNGGSVEKSSSAAYFPNKHVYIAAMVGSNIHVMRRVFEHALHYHPIQELVFLVDDVMLNTNRPLGAGWNDSNYYGSPTYYTPLERALQMVDFSMLQSSVGLWLANSGRKANDTEPLSYNHDIQAQWRQNVAEFSRRDLYGCYEIGSAPVSELDQIIVLAKRHNVKVTLISSFIHPAFFEFFYDSDGGKGLRRFLTVLRNAAVKYSVPAWYYTPYSPIARGTPRIHYFQPAFYDAPDFADPGHANFLMYTRLFDRAFLGKKNSDVLGWLLNDVKVDDIMNDLHNSYRKNQAAGGISLLKQIPKLVADANCPVGRKQN